MRQPRGGPAPEPARPPEPDRPAGRDRAAAGPPPRAPAERPDRPAEDRIVRTATEARQGEIILGRYGRWIWIGAFVALLLLVLLFGL
jgi:hypothetical protein